MTINGKVLMKSMNERKKMDGRKKMKEMRKNDSRVVECDL